MNDHELQQRIKYLVEHGGIWDDPLDEVRRSSKYATWAGGLAVLLHIVHFAVH